MSKLYIFIGQSGAGKGTQVALLKEKLVAIDPSTTPFYIETGSKFRELIASDNPTATLTKSLMSVGKLPPSFLGVHMWAHELIYNYDGKSDALIDGTPRVIAEVPILLSAIGFYGWDAHVIHIGVSDEWAYDKTTGRGREDDKDANDVWGRIQWFHESVKPAIDALRESPQVEFHDVNGEQTIEEVHADICRSLGI